MKTLSPEIEKYRLTKGFLRSGPEYGMNGVFIVPGPRGIRLICIISNGMGWEHVSVERTDKPDRIGKKVPYWDEMDFIKNFFWGPEETVIQYHPPESVRVNIHPGVLHLWKPVDIEIPVPPQVLV